MPGLRKGAAIAFEVAAFSLLGVSLAWLMWAVVEPVGPLGSAATVSPTSDRAEKLVARLARLPSVAMAGSGSASPAQLASGFVLHATRADTNGRSTAILSVNGAPQGSYALGDDIPGGARLVFVAADHVEIESSGQRLRVEFSGAERDASVTRASAPVESRSAPIDQMINALPLQPVSRPGGRSAFAVMAQADLSTLGASGLQAGDILLKVDGVDVSVANLANYAAQLQSGRTFEVVFERNGQIGSTRIGKPAP